MGSEGNLPSTRCIAKDGNDCTAKSLALLRPTKGEKNGIHRRGNRVRMVRPFEKPHGKLSTAFSSEPVEESPRAEVLEPRILSLSKDAVNYPKPSRAA
jgi:hypothetical protein